MLTKNNPSNLKAPFIAFVGVMGVGKSALAQAIAKKMGAESMIEPGAEAWPIDADKWEENVFILEEWVRNTNLTSFREARSLTSKGSSVVSDGGLFLIAKDCIDDPSCQFYYGLLNEKEKQILRQETLEDWNEAPCPDILVLLETDIDTWKKLLATRGRKMDDNLEFIANYSGQQRVIREAAQRYTAEKGIKLITFKNQYSTSAESADRLYLEVEILLKEPAFNKSATIKTSF
jgi:deoxyadenosine/deoxycytidine kinase